MSQAVTTNPLGGYGEAASIDTLARTLWAEARGEGHRGMQAVANVVMNRVRLGGWWGHSVLAVCRFPFQFSCWNHDDPNLPKLMQVNASDREFADAVTIATYAVHGQLPDITNGADSYFRNGTPVPKWAKDAKTGDAKPPIAVIGHHWFYQTRQ